MFILRVILTAILLALIGCTKRPEYAVPFVTEQMAAKSAATCLDWPKGIRDAASKLSKEDKYPYLGLDFTNAPAVAIDANGTCVQIDTMEIHVSPGAELPPRSFTELGGWIYILMRYSFNAKTGDRVFIGIKTKLQHMPSANTLPPVQLPTKKSNIKT